MGNLQRLSVVGKRVPRVDALDQVRGTAKYGVDLKLPGMLYGKILRSVHSHAKILSLDTSQAERLPGVKAVVTGKDLPNAYAAIRRGIVDEHALAVDKVRYIGDEVAAVVATSEDIAEEALKLIKVDYEKLPAVYDLEEAMKQGAPKIHGTESNIAAEIRYERGDVDKGLENSDYVFEDRFETKQQHQCHLEPQVCVADFDASGKLSLWITSMDPSRIRILLAKALNMEVNKIRVIHPYIGGCFGAKNDLQRLYVICALLTKKAHKPVKIVHTREEELSVTRPRVAMIIKLRTGIMKDGTLMARDVRIMPDAGAYAGYSPKIAGIMSEHLLSLYRCPNVRVESKTVYTNKMMAGPFRGFGVPQAMFACESQMDIMAEKLGIDPIDLRMKNVTRPGDVTASGWKIGTLGVEECVKKVTEYSHWKEKREKRIRNRGIGIAFSIYISDNRSDPEGFGGSVAFVKVLEDGKIRVLTGESDYGQGMRTIFAQIAAEELGIPVEDIEIFSVDTDITPFSLGPYGDRVTISGGNAVRLAAQDAKRQLLEVAAEMMGTATENLEIRNRKISVKGLPERCLSISDVVDRAIFRSKGSIITGKGIDERDTEGRDLTTWYGNCSTAYTFAAQIAEVEVDTETGKIELLNFVTANDLGKAINPTAAEGQAEGQVSQGIGMALMEEIMYKDGNVVNPNFMDYRIPTALDMPPIKTFLVEAVDPNGPCYGAKGAGEATISPPPAAIANAVHNAIGVRIKELPLNPERVLEALELRGKIR